MMLMIGLLLSIGAKDVFDFHYDWMINGQRDWGRCFMGVLLISIALGLVAYEMSKPEECWFSRRC